FGATTERVIKSFQDAQLRKMLQQAGDKGILGLRESDLRTEGKLDWLTLVGLDLAAAAHASAPPPPRPKPTQAPPPPPPPPHAPRAARPNPDAPAGGTCTDADALSKRGLGSRGERWGLGVRWSEQDAFIAARDENVQGAARLGMEGRQGGALLHVRQSALRPP